MDDDQMIEAWLAGELAEDHAVEFSRRLRGDRSLARRLLLSARFETDLKLEVSARIERRALGFGSDRQFAIPQVDAPAARPARNPWSIAVAALLIIAVGFGLVRLTLRQPEKTTLAEVIAASGPVELRSGTRVEAAMIGSALTADSQLVVGSGGRAEVRNADGSIFVCLPGTIFSPVAEGDGRRFYLTIGRVDATIAAMPDEATITIATPHAQLNALGANFQLKVDAERSDVSVTSGHLTFDDRNSLERHIVHSGDQQLVHRKEQNVIPRTPATPDPRIGIELSGVGSTSIEQPFVDVFRCAAPWKSSDDRPLVVDADGWVVHLEPGQRASTLMCSNLAGRYRGGRYVCTYRGNGKLTFGGDAKVIERRDGRISLEVDPSDTGIEVHLDTTDESDWPHAIRIFPQDAETTLDDQPFQESFLNRWRGAGVIHTGGWTESVDGDRPYRWADRRHLAQAPQPPGRGRPLEEVLALGRALDADVWLRLPHQVSDDYVIEAARLVHSLLPTGRRVYVELGRDLWDGAWEPGKYALARGKELDLKGHAAVLWYAQRSLEIFDLWRSVCGNDPRLIRVLCMTNSAYSTEEMLNWKDAAAHADVLAVNANFGAILAANEDPDTVFDLDAASFAEIMREPLHDLPKRLEDLRTRAHGLRVVGYRAGPFIAVSQNTNPKANWRHYVHAGSFLNLPDVRTIMGEWMELWQRGNADVMLVSLPLNRLREVEGKEGEPVDAMGLQAYQAVAPWLERQQPRKVRKSP